MLIKNKKCILTISLLIIILIGLLLKIANPKDYSIQPSTLPQNELWTIEQAEKVLDKAYQIGIPRIKDEKALLELVKQAYQWDKNAMIQYARIQKNEMEIEPDKEESLTEFLKKYSYELVDGNGKPLATPTILDLNYSDFMKVLADKGYPEPSLYIVSFDTTINHDELVSYVKNIIKGGKRYHGMLANSILFPSSSGYKDYEANIMYKLPEHILTLSSIELEEASNNYIVCAKHGDQYCMVRIVEANYYGIGVKQNLEQAYVWTQLANQANQLYFEKAKLKPDNYRDSAEEVINNYNLELATKLKEQLTPVQLEQSQKIVKQFKPTISWDYEVWVSKRDPVPPML